VERQATIIEEPQALTIPTTEMPEGIGPKERKARIGSVRLRLYVRHRANTAAPYLVDREMMSDREQPTGCEMPP
jgi:hypothetical protein